jgi:hypothetical protein
MRSAILAAALALAGLAPHLAAAKDGAAAVDEATVGMREPTLFRVQPTIESVRDGLALKGPPTAAELGLRNAIERSAHDLRDKMIICRGC